MRQLIVLLSLMSVTAVALAKDLGSQGQTFVVQEQDFSVLMKTRLAMLQRSGELDALDAKAKARMISHVYHPTALALSTRSDTKVIVVDPSVVLNRPVTDNTGRVLVKAGTRINPFKTIHLQAVLIFFNGDDPAQVAWVASHYQQFHGVKFILTGGKLRAMAKRFGRIYFDQNGTLTKRLHITTVPAVAKQASLRWQITLIGTKAF